VKQRRRTVKDITITACFVTTMKLQHALQVQSIISANKCMWLHFSS